MSLGSGEDQHSSSRLTRLTSARFRGRAPGPVSGRLYGKRPVGGPALSLPLSRCLSTAGVGFLGVLFPPRSPAPLTVGLPAPPSGQHRTLTGFPRFPRMSYGRVGCQLYPGSSGVPATVDPCSVAACRFSTARSLSSPPSRPDLGSCRNEASPLVHSRSPFRPSPHLWHPVGTGTLGLSPELRTQPLPATHVRAGTGLEH